MRQDDEGESGGSDPAQSERRAPGHPEVAASRRGGQPAPQKRWFRVLIWSLVIVAVSVYVPAVVGLAWVDYGLLADIVGRRSFSPEEWKKLAHASSDSERRDRQSMAEDLLAKRNLVGMSQTAIVELLGPGDFDACFSKRSRPYVFSYRLRDQAFVDQNYLVIEFDDTDLVASASLRSN